MKQKDAALESQGISGFRAPSQNGRLSDLFSATLKEWYDAKHRRASPEEIALVNSLPIDACPRCGSADFRSDGHDKRGIRRYECKSCGRKFRPLTGTLFDSAKIPVSEWIEFWMHIFENHSVSSSANDNRNNEKTGRYWLWKGFSALSSSQDGKVLSGRVYADEKFLTESRGKLCLLDGGKRPRGLSRNKICVFVATDGVRIVAVANGKGKPSAKRCLEALGGHIAPGSILVHDGEKSHNALIRRLSLKSEVHPTAETKGMRDKDNPLETVNRVHAKMARFFEAHGSYARENVQGWLNVFVLGAESEDDPYRAIMAMIKAAISTKEVIRFRDLFPKKSDKSD